MRIAFQQIGWLLLLSLLAPVAADDWPHWRGPQRDGTWTETGLVTRFDADQLQPLWRTPLGPGYTGPTVADGRCFVMDRQAEPDQQERVVCLDATTGNINWEYSYPCVYRDIGYEAGPRAAVEIIGNRAYALGAMGNLHCLNVEDGTLLWARDLNGDYAIAGDGEQKSLMPVWGIAASPLAYRDLLILHIGGRDGACVVALRQMDGTEAWRALEDRAQYSTPILVRQAEHDVCVVWTGDSVAGLDPATGKLFWRHPFTPSRMPIGVATPLERNGLLFVTSFYDGAQLLQMNAKKLEVDSVWEARGPNEQQTKALHSIISTPVWLEDHIYGVDSYGELRCLRADTGERVWEDLSATPKARWSTIHFVQNGSTSWMFNERGELIIGQLSPTGFRELDRAKIIEPTEGQLPQRNGVCWSHPAFANRRIFVRNDREIVCVDLAEIKP